MLVIWRCLLVATIGYAAMVLNRKLGRASRKSKDEMESLIKDFAEATAKAEPGLEAITAARRKVQRQGAAAAGDAWRALSCPTDSEVSWSSAAESLGRSSLEANIAKGRGKPCKGSNRAGKVPAIDRKKRAISVSGALKAMAEIMGLPRRRRVSLQDRRIRRFPKRLNLTSENAGGRRFAQGAAQECVNPPAVS